jgi:hypothetical protein
VYEKSDILIDREQDSEVVVVQLSSDRADEYVIKERDPSENRYSDQTVYDYNSRYGCDSQERVYRAVYTEALPSDPHELTKEGRVLLAQNADVKLYAFPVSRLTSTDDS